MITILDDYYKDFEGEGEIDFIRIKNNGDKIILKLWQGYFDTLLDEILHNIDMKNPSELTGILKCYYNLSNFYDYKPYYLDNIQLEIDSFNKYNAKKTASNKKLESNTLIDSIDEIRDVIVNFLSEALQLKDKVYIQLE